MMPSITTILVTWLLVQHDVRAATPISTDAFMADLSSIANDGLGVGYIQKYIDSHVTWNRQTVDGTVHVNKYAAEISALLKTRFSLVRRLRDSVQTHYSNWADLVRAPYQECCKAYVGSEADFRFRGYVNRDHMCVRQSMFAQEGPKKFAEETLLNVFKKNLRNETGLKWQYFGTEQGLLFNYPSQKASDCNSYDPRFRPWYIQTATPKPKDVVIVVDQSGSMGDYVTSEGQILPQVDGRGRGLRTLMDLAREAAHTLISSFNPRDRVGVVGFSSTSFLPQGNATIGTDCYARELALATPQTKDFLNGFVDKMKPVAYTFYSEGLKGAFSLFGESDSVTDIGRRKVILFLTDGRPSDGEADIMKVISDYNGNHVGREVSIYTFGIGQSDNTFLTRMATEHQPIPGRSYSIQNVNRLRQYMASYYSSFLEPDLTQPVVSVPYFDAFGLGMVLTVSLPVYVRSAFVGVVGIDLSLTEIVAPALFADHAMVVDSQTGYTMAHPLLPQPYSVLDDPAYVRLNSLDTSDGARVMENSLLFGSGEGSQDTLFTSYTSRGEYYRGPAVSSLHATYFWARVDNTSLGVALVLEDAVLTAHETAVINPSDVMPSQVSFNYHNFHVLHNPPPTCRNFLRKTIKDATTVKLGAPAFLNPFTYLDTNETDLWIGQYAQEVRSGRSGNFIRPEALLDIYFTSKVEDVWFSQNSHHEMYSIWRYIATPNSVIRVGPGISLHKNYDPVQRPWYKRAVAQQGALAVTAPYLDAFGAGYVVTLSQALYATSPAGTKVLMTVMGIDFPSNYFASLLDRHITECDGGVSCIVLDDQGYLVTHPSFITFVGSESPAIDDVHVTAREGELSKAMISGNQMHQKSCYKMDQLESQTYYDMTGASTTWSLTVDGETMERVRIADTNIHLVVYSHIINQGCSCSSKSLPVPPECLPGSPSCTCPCFKLFKFEYCSNRVPDNSHHTPCLPPPPPTDMAVNVKREFETSRGLPRCYEPACRNMTGGERECEAVAGCSWCSQNMDGGALRRAYCGYSEECYFGRVGWPNPYGIVMEFTAPPGPTPKADSTAAIVGSVVAGVVLLVGIGIVVYLRKRGACARTNRNPSRADHSIASAPTVEPSNPPWKGGEQAPPPPYGHAMEYHAPHAGYTNPAFPH